MAIAIPLAAESLVWIPYGMLVVPLAYEAFDDKEDAKDFVCNHLDLALGECRTTWVGERGIVFSSAKQWWNGRQHFWPIWDHAQSQVRVRPGSAASSGESRHPRTQADYDTSLVRWGDIGYSAKIGIL